MERIVLKVLHSQNDSISSNSTNQIQVRHHPVLIDSGCSSISSDTNVFTSGRLSDSSNGSKTSVSDTAKRLMQLRLIKRQTTTNSRNSSQSLQNDEFSSFYGNLFKKKVTTNAAAAGSQLGLNNYLQALLDRSVEQISDGLGQSATWSQLAPLSQPLSYDQFKTCTDDKGRLLHFKFIQFYVYRHGVQPSARPLVWKHLLYVYRPNASWCERNALDQQHRAQYEHLKCNWQSKWTNERVQQTYQQVAFVTKFKLNLINIKLTLFWFFQKQVQKDALQTDSNHLFFVLPHTISCDRQHSTNYSCPQCLAITPKTLSPNQLSLTNVVVTFALNNRLGYQPGMLDMCTPLLLAMGDECTAYTCFCALMRKIESNFETFKLVNQLTTLRLLLQHFDPELFAHLQAQQTDHLLFTFRWLMLQLKREFPLESIPNVFEVLWASTPPSSTPPALQLFDQPFCNDQTNLEILHSYANQSNVDHSVNHNLISPSSSWKLTGHNSNDLTDGSGTWPAQVRNAMRSLYSNLEQAMRTKSSKLRSASPTGDSSGHGSCSSLASVRTLNQVLPNDAERLNRSFGLSEELFIEPSIELCNLLQTQLGTSIPFIRSTASFPPPISASWRQMRLLDFSLPPSSINAYKTQPVRPRRSIRFLPKILSNDSAEMIDSPDADCNAKERFVFPPKPIDKQTSVDSLDLIETNRCSSAIVASTRPLDRHSNSFDEQRKYQLIGNNGGNTSVVATAANLNGKVPASRTHSAGHGRRQLNRIPPPLRLTGSIAIWTQRSLPNSPLLKKKQDSFERATGNAVTQQANTAKFRQISAEEKVAASSSGQRKAPDRCDSLDPADQLVHCSGDQLDDSLYGGTSFGCSEQRESPASNGVGSAVSGRKDWAPEVGLLDNRFDSFDTDYAPPSLSDACPGLRAAFGWRSRTSALATVANVVASPSSPSSSFNAFGSMSKNSWKSRQTNTQRQTSIGSLSSDSSGHSCDECDQKRNCSRRRSLTDDLALNSNIVLVCGQGAAIPGTYPPSLMSPGSPTLQENQDDVDDDDDDDEDALAKQNYFFANKYEDHIEQVSCSRDAKLRAVQRFSATSNPSCPQLQPDNAFLLFTCLTMLLQHREPILSQKMNSQQIYSHFDRLTRFHNAPQVLKISRQLFSTYLRGRQNIEQSLQSNQW